MMAKHKDGCLFVVTGATRSGKGAWIKQQVGGASRLLVWDPKPDYCAGRPADFPLKNMTIIRSPSELFNAVQTTRPARIGFVAPTDPKLFEWWAKCAYIFARLAPAVLVAEETSDVTNPGKAPKGWGELCRKVLVTGSDLYAVTQRPAESDKTAFGNATIFHVGRMSRAKDRKYMAEEMDIPTADIARLGDLEYIEKDNRTLKVTTGRVSFKGK